MAKEDYSRRLNLIFDDLDLDVLEWLNSFGKRKRARVAKEALRKAMNEGFRASYQPEIRPSPAKKEPSKPKDISKKIVQETPKKPQSSCNPEDTTLNNLILDLVGVENNSEILSYLSKDKEVST